MRFFTFVALCFALTFFSGCGKDKIEKEPELPPVVVETSGMRFINPITIEMTGKVLNEHKQKVIDHGFVWGYSQGVDLTNGTKISLGGNIVEGFFTAILKDFKPTVVDGIPLPLYFRTYVVDKNGMHFGGHYTKNYIGFVTDDILPSSGKVGDLVVIKADFKGMKESDIVVKMEGQVARITSFTESAVTVEVPKSMPLGHGDPARVRLTVGTAIADVTDVFRVWANITDINPKSGPVGTKITLTGDNLPLAVNSMYMRFDEALAINEFDGTYAVRVPMDVDHEKIKFYQYTDKRVLLPWEFTVTPPVIKSIVPNPVLRMGKVSIQLENSPLKNIRNDVIVKIGDYTTNVVPDANGDLTVGNLDLPAGKSYDVSVVLGPHTVHSSVPLTISRAEATGFSPNRGFPGTAIHLNGKFVKGGAYWITFDDSEPVGGYAISETEAVFYVPSSIGNKSYSIKLKESAGNVPVPGLFEGQAMRFDAITPASSVPHTRLVLTGEGFFAQGSNYILIGQSFSLANFISSKEVEFQTPDIDPGTYPVKVKSGDHIFDTGLAITIMKR